MATLLVQSPEITRLLDDETGKPLDAVDVVGDDRHLVMVLYKALHISRKTGQGRLLCALCGVPVYLCSAPDRQHFYFKHFQEDGSCPAVTRARLTEDQINALRYHGQRESKRHIRIKNLVADSLRNDPQFSETVIEGTWKGREGKEHRRPDVRSTFKHELKVAFEVQLSTTFGRVMAEREVFYKSEGGLLVWVFGQFDLDHARLMMEVIFNNNNRNAFVINEATEEASKEAGALVLECHWAQPSRHKDKIIWVRQRKLVRFNELTIDQERQRAFYVDTEALEARLQEEIDGPPLWKRFEDFWLTYEAFEGRLRPDVDTIDRQWEDLRQRFNRKGVQLPSRHDFKFVGMVRSIFLAKLGRAVGWKYQQFWPAAHHVPDAEKANLWLFVEALRHYGRLAGIEQQDTKGRWAEKMAKWGEGVASGSSDYREEHCFDSALRLAFPELTGLIPEFEQFKEDDPPPF